MLKPLPTSTATLGDIIRGNYLYIDKTRYVYEIVKNPKGAFFLSRPRRFGKSLLISTLEEIFKGQRQLFRGLWLDSSDYQWDVYPVIRFDFSLEPATTADEFKDTIHAYLSEIAAEHGVDLPEAPYYRRFRHLIQKLAAQSGHNRQVVILIDEYDKPLIENLENLPEAYKIRQVLKGFYGVLKSMERHIRLTFITGVSKFSRVSIFSELNHLSDLTLDERFADILGITQAELIHYFQDYLPAFAAKEKLTVEQLLEKIRHWYDGFRFTRAEGSLYNPFSTMNLFEKSSFHNYWFESGTPTFLIKLLHRQNYEIEQINHLQVEELAFSTYDIEQLAIIPLLFQTGYLTIKGYNLEERLYALDYPNYEVENAFLIYLLDAFSRHQQGLSASHLWHLIDALQQRDLDLFFANLKVFFANIDYSLYLENEKYYQTIFYLIFKLMGLRIDAEVQTNDGRIDAVAETSDCIYLFEFKINRSGVAALKQIQDHKYYQKYQLRGKPILCIGANFSTKTRTVDDWMSEVINPR